MLGSVGVMGSRVIDAEIGRVVEVLRTLTIAR